MLDYIWHSWNIVGIMNVIEPLKKFLLIDNPWVRRRYAPRSLEILGIA